MDRDKKNNSTDRLPALAAFRGLYHRVATKLDLDPSYVSRVARGERRSPAVLAALREEIAKIRDQLNDGVDGKGNINGHHHPDGHQGGGALQSGKSGHSAARKKKLTR